MSEEQPQQPMLKPVGKPLNLIPVGLKEAALDSPTFRATAVHFAEQTDIVERWLDGYVKAASKLAHDVSSLETLVNALLAQSTPPAQISEAVLDHDYTLLAMRRYGEGAKEFWQYTLRGIKRSESVVVEPIKSFLSSDLRTFKEARKVLELSQKTFDSLLARYSAQGKTKEASSLREDAFQLHEARRAYLKASMDFCVLAPQIRTTLDKLLVRIFCDQWKDLKNWREASTNTFGKWNSEMERIRGWSREMENSERAFKKELQIARRQLEDSAELMARPPRELDDYATSTVPYLGTAPSTQNLGSLPKPAVEKSEKQGWLFLRTVTGRPARTVWSRRWFFVKNGIFGWLVQGSRSGGVEESEKIGVLLCGVRPAFQEERRFCFEVKTKDTSIVLQAETQHELNEWINAFEAAKRKALEDPASTEPSPAVPGVDPAFAISPPIASALAAKAGEAHLAQSNEELSSVLGVSEQNALTSRSSFDVASSRRSTMLDRGEGEIGRDHGARIIQKLDLHKKSTASPRLNADPASAGGIASLISASHNILPVGPLTPAQQSFSGDTRSFTMPASTLTPSTLANPPAPTNLSKTAVAVSGERGVGLGFSDVTGGTPSGIMANLWGTTNWGHVNRLERGEVTAGQARPTSSPNSPAAGPSRPLDEIAVVDGLSGAPRDIAPASADTNRAASPQRVGHRKTISLGSSQHLQAQFPTSDGFPNYYPLPLKAQDAQFRVLFPGVPRVEKVVLVFRATWNPNEQQEFPGRVYVTAKEIYFYSHHLGLVLTTAVSLSAISEVTAAPGRDCDFLFLHLKDSGKQSEFTRITIKTFLEPLKLVQRRLNYLAHNANQESPASLEDVLKSLIKMEADRPSESSSMESWEDVQWSAVEEGESWHAKRRAHDMKASLRIDGTLYGEAAGRSGREVMKFKLPAQPVVYAPQGMSNVTVTRDFNASAKALFHVMFGDKSAVFQMLYRNRWTDTISQSPWSQTDSKPFKRQFTYAVDSTKVMDVQVIDILNDHLCYVVTDTKTPWHLPHSSSFYLTSKFVITHSAKSKCKLAIYNRVDWQRPPRFPVTRRLIERQALSDLEADALDLTNLVALQVSKLGAHSKTNKALNIFGQIGQHNQVTQVAASDTLATPSSRTRAVKSRTLIGLFADEAGTRALDVLGIVANILGAIAKGALNVCTAHTLLITLLVLSALYNSFHTYKTTFVWWHERNAANYMARLGVAPDPLMSKAVYLHDVEYMLSSQEQNSTIATYDGQIRVQPGTTNCRITFLDTLHASSPTATVVDAEASLTRLHRTRTALAKYRHALLVAMRVVNRIESEVVHAEWENWVEDESRKCAQLEAMISSSSESDGKEGKEGMALRGLGKLEEYCNTCWQEVEGLSNKTGY
ncbi:SNF1-interacting protein [Elasticomyces elasticus]|nr:SNF1-interacting protein [Elasticomyces elasticus]